ncbi:MAG: hypothetical protein QOI82_2436 [Actinomycetota bacterium]|nr:hypothetical protein [Actinomycetota bacterium]
MPLAGRSWRDFPYRWSDADTLRRLSWLGGPQ